MGAHKFRESKSVPSTTQLSRISSTHSYGAVISPNPFYAFTGSDDEISTPENVFKLYEQCPAKVKALWVAPNSDHSNIIFNYTDQYFSNIYLFLNSTLTDK